VAKPAADREDKPRFVGDKVMLPADLKRLHEDMLEVEHIDHISDEMRGRGRKRVAQASTQAAAEETAGLTSSVLRRRQQRLL
jgi:hypothetical protein